MFRFEPGDHVVEEIDDAIHNLLNDAETVYVLEHCKTCPICMVAMAEAAQRQATVRTLPVREASEQLIRQTVRNVLTAGEAAARRVQFFRRIVYYSAAACLLILASLHVYYYTMTPSTFDLRVLGQTDLLADSQASLRAQLLQAGAPAPGAAISVDILDASQTVRLARFTTDSNGTGSPRFHLPDWPAGNYTLRVTSQSGFDTQTVTEAVRLTRSWKLMLSTDKPVYQPGQTIHVRSLALRKPDLKPVAGQPATFAIADPRGNIIFKQVGVTSPFGIAATDCPLATEIIEGDYAISCRIGDTESKSTVSVKPYVLPKFKVNLTLDQPFYQPGQRVRVAVQADYFFGQHVGGATVSLVSRSMDVSQTRLADATAQANAEGLAMFDFVLPNMLFGTPKDGGDARILLHATVRDAAGQEQSRDLSAVVANSPIHIEVIPESGRLVSGLSNRIFILTTYADGRPAKCRLAVSGITNAISTNDLGAGFIEITPMSGDLTLSVDATDNAGLRAQSTAQLSCDADVNNYLIRTDKSVCRGGETLHLQAFGGGTEPLFIDLIKDGQTLFTQTMEMSAGKGSLALDLPPDLFGTVQLVGYRFGADGLPIRKALVLYIEQASDLHIKTTLDRAEYRPGAPAKLSFEITDQTGKPVPGALSVAAVDEAVFSVLEQAPGMEKTFFNLEQQQLQPVYAIYPWSPHMPGDGRDEDAQLLNDALFAKTAGATTDRDALLERMIRDGEISPRVIKSFNNPQIQQYIRRMLEESDLSADEKAALMNGGPHTLAATTGQANVERVEQIRRERLELLPVLWIVAVIAIAITFSFMWSGGGGVVRVIVVLVVIAFLIALMLPSLGRARESARRVAAMSDANDVLRTAEIDREKNVTVSKVPSISTSAEPRLREYFPETLLWRPEIITDDKGRASIDLDMADSITTWRLSASAVSADGQLGAATTPIRVFQPFFVDVNLPVSLTRGDEIALPVVVYNYLNQPQTVDLSLDAAADGWYTLLEPADKHITLAPGQVLSVSYRIRATKVGAHAIQVTAKAADVSDAIKRNVDVVPDGRKVEQVVSGSLTNPVDVALLVPPDAIEGSVKATVKLYPSSFSQLVEGLDSIFQAPYGCFEQTSSTTYPNVLALDYLQRNNKSSPAVEATARSYIHLGYQRLLSFEIAGGGFDWFGQPAANRTLSAYGLMEFQDMAKVHDVDPNVIARTRAWLLQQREADGSWTAAGHAFYHDDPTQAGRANEQITTTAYIAWSVFKNGAAPDGAALTRSWLHAHISPARDNPYTLALIANALIAIDARDSNISAVLERLDQIKSVGTDGKTCCWAPTSSTAFYGRGQSGAIETTAMAALAMIHGQQYPESTRQALAWLIMQKDPRGTWYSTQATVLALKAIVEGTGKPLGGERGRTILLQTGADTQTITIAPDQSDVMKQIDITPRLASGRTSVKLSDATGTATTYQVTLQFYVPDAADPAASEPLTISIDYNRTNLTVGQQLAVTATISNKTAATIPMLLVDLPIPAGFSIDTEGLSAMVQKEEIAKFQITPRSAILYLRSVPAGQSLALKYTLQATMPVRVLAPAATVYEYYKPENRAESKSRLLTVQAL